MMSITIITPTYNRAQYLQKVYESLLNQTDQHFQWLVIDDGSTDNTVEIMEKIISEHIGEFSINFFRKNNGGKHSALNFSHNYINEELVTILDSDDVLIDEAVETIKFISKKYQSEKKIGWFAYLKGHTIEESIGSNYTKDYDVTTYIEYMNNGRKGEACDVYKTEVFKKYPYPEFSDEKFVSESYLNIQASLYGQYKMMTINRILVLADYNEDGLTKQGRKLQLLSPKGHAELWRHVSFDGFSIKQSLKGTWLYIAYSYFSRYNTLKIINNSRKKVFTAVNIPAGYLIFLIWKFKYFK